jgi:serine protease Do
LRTRAFVLLCLSLPLSLTACGPNQGPSKEAVVQRPLPIPLGDAGSHAMSFQKVVFRISSGTLLGEARTRGKVFDEIRWSRSSGASTEFNVAVTDAFRTLGYDMRDSADALFEPGGTVKVRYELAAILHSTELDFEYKYDSRRYRIGEGIGRADVRVEVRLRDVIQDKTVFSRSFEGHGEDTGLEPNPIAKAVVDAITQSTSDSAFVELVAKRPGMGGPDDSEQTRVVVCVPKAEMLLPGGLSDVLKSVVEVQVGGTIGAGVLISPDGWILTAHHVVSGATEIWVRLNNGIQLPARLHQDHPFSDVSLIKLEGRNYPCAPPRRTDEELSPGSEVFAINIAVGDGTKPTVSRGVVAGYAEDEGQLFIQTDASINAGSSGGPLFSPSGRVAGVTVAKMVGFGVEGLGFAVPVDDAIRNLSIHLQSN